ncbi:MAG: hypothetical protein ACLRSW_07955 [Christensenellaceae bacterium]
MAMTQNSFAAGHHQQCRRASACLVADSSTPLRGSGHKDVYN